MTLDWYDHFGAHRATSRFAGKGIEHVWEIRGRLSRTDPRFSLTLNDSPISVGRSISGLKKRVEVVAKLLGHKPGRRVQ